MRRMIFIIIFLLLFPDLLSAGHDFVMGTGIVTQGFAGAGSANSGEPSLIFLNPSRIASGDQTIMSLGLILGHKDLKINDKSFEKGDFTIIEGGFILPFSGKLSGLYFGLSLTFPQPSIMYLYSQDPTYPQFVNFRNINRYAIKPALAYNIKKRLSLGVAVDVFGDSTGRAKVMIDLANQKTTQSDFIMDQKFTYSPILGCSYDFSREMTVSLSYRFENRLNLKIDTNFDMQLLNMNVIEYGQSFFIPAEITLGVMVKPLKDLKLLLDLGYMFFSDMPDQYVVVDIEPSVLFPSVKNNQEWEISAKDILRVKIGGGYSLLNGRLIIRTGYQYFPTAIPDQIYATNLLDSDRHIFALGSGIHLDDPIGLLTKGLDFNLYFQYHYLVKRKFNKEDPLDAYGDYTIAGGIYEVGFGISFSM